jgi:hypothetical protein
MQKLNTLSPPSSHRLLKNKIDKKGNNNHPHYKSTNISKEKIYYFRTSLFTEKSKKIIQKMNYSQSKLSKDIYDKKELNTSPITPGCRTSFKKSEKIFIFGNNNENIEKIKTIKNNHFVAYLYKKGKNDNRVDVDANQKLRKSSNLINVNFNNDNNTEIKKSQNKIREKELNKEDDQKKNYIIVSDIKKCKLFSNIKNNNVVINNKNNKKNASNKYNGQNQSKFNKSIINTIIKKEVSNQNKQIKVSDYNKKTKCRLKSRKSMKKKKENVNAISYKSININNNNNIKKELKEIKFISKYSKILPISIFDKRYYASKSKLGNYNTERKNDRYGSKNAIRNDKKNRRKFIQSEINNIASLKDKDDIRLSRKGKIV